MLGTRRPDGTEAHWLDAGDYSLCEGSWWCCAPNGARGNLSSHDVVEHDDGTVTVSPSILISDSVNGQRRDVYHGYLERGEWREV